MTSFHPRPRSRRGFALVIVLSLMILLTLLAVGLLTLSSVSLRGGGQREAVAVARNNARLALVLAIGELQQTLGPDKAVSASSNLLAERSAKPNLTGVWESWDYQPDSGNPDYDGEKEQRFRRWLVSGRDREETGRREFGNTPWRGETVELVGKGVFGEDVTDDQRVVAGLVPVTRQGRVGGACAWHVADESAKARINLYRQPVDANDSLARKRAGLAGHRPDPSRLEAAGGAGSLAFLPQDLTAKEYSAAEETTGKVVDLEQVDLLGARKQVREFRHDVTPYSLGLLTDVRGGGLKQDLSSVFEMNTTLPAEFNGKRLYQSTHGISGVSDPYWSTLSGYYNVFRSLTEPDTNPTFYQRPPERVVVTNLAPPRKFHPAPVIAKIETLFSYVTRDAHANWVNTLHGVDPNMHFMGHLIYTPLVTLHNPYNVNLSFDSFEVVIRNPPVAFNFYVNDRPQNSQLVSLTDMFVYGSDRTEKSFALKIANWSSPTASSPRGQIVMKPGQTLVCGPYLNPDASFSDKKDTNFFDWQNNLTGYKDNNGQATVNPINAKPGFVGRCVGFDVDWVTPTHNGLNSGQQTDNNQGVLGLRATDRVHVEFAMARPTVGLNTEFQVTAKLTARGATQEYGGMIFRYQDESTLKRLFKKTYRFPTSGSLSHAETYVPNSDPISRHARAKTVAVFSAYARTTNGGVYETNKRVETNGALNVQRDGQLAGMPFLFHNPARNVMTVDLRREKLGAHSHELNFQPLPGHVDDLFEVDASNRTPGLTGNTTLRGLKSGSYLELPSGPMQTIAGFRRSNALTSAYLPNLTQPVGNSIISPLMTTDKVVATDTTIASYPLLDHSTLANHALYDRFYFSTFATDGDQTPDEVFEGFMRDGRRLALQSFQPHLPPGRTVEEAKGELYASGKPRDTAYQTAAQYQLIRGPFNVNSTSVQAWKAVLSALNKSDAYTLWARSGFLEVLKTTGVPVPSMSLLNGGRINGGAVDPNKIDNTRTNEWNGLRELSDREVEELAKRIVEQVRARGPFLSLSEFVNRRVGDESELTRSGALEVALAKAQANSKVFTTQIPLESADFTNQNLYNYRTPLATVGNPAAGAPGWISQGDLMHILEPAATVRGDTFVIRVCGEARDTAGKVTARVFAEAVVQRMPEYVDSIDPSSMNVYNDPQAAPANRRFGRRMALVSFRWLNADEI